MISLKRVAFLTVLLGSTLFGTAASPFSFVAAADPAPQWRTEYQVWGKEAKPTPKPGDPSGGAWIHLGTSATRAGAEQTIVTITRHGGFVSLHIKEKQVRVNRPGDGMVRTRPPIKEIKPLPPAPKPAPGPKGIDVLRPATATPVLTKPLQKVTK